MVHIPYADCPLFSTDIHEAISIVSEQNLIFFQNMQTELIVSLDFSLDYYI